MKRFFTSSLCLLLWLLSVGQGLVKVGDMAPNYLFTKMINAPDSVLAITHLKGKPIILAFWGTWCSPCIPEIINLGKLQAKFRNRITIIGVSDDSEEKLNYFIKKRPTKLWFASDPSNNLWNIFGIQSAGHAALIDQNNVIVGIIKTSKLDSILINQVVTQDSLAIAEDKGTQRLPPDRQATKLDSNVLYSFILQPELKGVTPMMKKPRSGTFASRRITVVNLTPAVIFEEAYDISLSKEITYPTKDDSLKSNVGAYCVDFIVPDSDKTNLKSGFQAELSRHLPFLIEKQRKLLPCYVLQPIKGRQVAFEKSADTSDVFSYDGLGI